jgi:hypothetical protein
MAHTPWRVLPYPSPSDPALKIHRGPFSEDQLEEITALGTERLRAAGEDVDTDLRRVRVVPLDHEPATAWIYSALGWAAQTVNGSAWQAKGFSQQALATKAKESANSWGLLRARPGYVS